MALTLIKTALEKVLKSTESGCQRPSDYRCAECRDIGWIRTDRGSKKCDCLQRQIQARMLAQIPPEYRGMTLATVSPDPARHAKQSSTIQSVKANPGGSFLFCGRAGSGKSLMAWMLYREAIDADRSAVALPLSELLTQFRRYETGGDQIPAVTSEILRDDKRRYFVFLDEFDKARPSEFASEQLFLIADAIYSFRHQFVITSNYGVNQLREHWSRASEQYGVSIMRRLLELDGMICVEMF